MHQHERGGLLCCSPASPPPLTATLPSSTFPCRGVGGRGGHASTENSPPLQQEPTARAQQAPYPLPRTCTSAHSAMPLASVSRDQASALSAVALQGRPPYAPLLASVRLDTCAHAVDSGPSSKRVPCPAVRARRTWQPWACGTLCAAPPSTCGAAQPPRSPCAPSAPPPAPHAGQLAGAPSGQAAR
jgi:hypothetical protein